MASARQFIELAVNMPEQEPQVGQAFSSMRAMSSSETASLADSAMAVIRSSLRTVPSTRTALPASIGPPETKTVGMFSRRAAMSMPGGDLVAVGDADQGVGAVRLDHVLDRVGDQVAGGQAVEHAAVAHGDAVVDRDGVELARDAAGLLDGVGDDPADRLEVGVAGDELGEAVGDRDDRLPEVLTVDSGCAQQCAGSRHVAAVGDRT